MMTENSQQQNQNLWWNMFEDKTNETVQSEVSDPTEKSIPVDPVESASSARSSLMLPESASRASSSSSEGEMEDGEEEEEEHDDADSENASTTTDTSSTATRNWKSKKGLGRGGTITALSGATLLLEAETDGDDTESQATDVESINLKTGNKDSVWQITNEQRNYYLREFAKLQPKLSGFIPGLLAKQYFLRSELPNHMLAEIWAMSDLDADGSLNITEFCCAMHLVVAVRNNVTLPSKLPTKLLNSALKIANQILSEQTNNSSQSQPPSAKKSNESNDNRAAPASDSKVAPWPGPEPISDSNKHNLSFTDNTSNAPSRASSMASNLASFDDRPPATALYPYAVRPAPALPTQIPPPPPPRRPPQQQQQQQQQQQSPPPPPPSSTTAPMSTPANLLSSHAVSASASSLQPLLPINDSASITSATSDSSQLQLLLPPLEQLRTRNQQLALRYRELLSELERVRLERTTLQTRLKQVRMSSGSHGSHRNSIEAQAQSIASNMAKQDRT